MIITESSERALSGQLDFLFKRIMNEIKKCRDNVLRSTGLTTMQCVIIEFIGSSPNGFVSQKEIEQFFVVQHPTISGIIKRMEAKGLVRCEINETDRRIKNIYLTEKASEYKYTFMESNLIVQEHLTRGLSEHDKAELYRLLSHVLDNFSE